MSGEREKGEKKDEKRERNERKGKQKKRKKENKRKGKKEEREDIFVVEHLPKTEQAAGIVGSHPSFEPHPSCFEVGLQTQ